MLEELRQQASETLDEEEALPAPPRPPARFLGMTPWQTFVIALLILFVTCLISSACLLATGRVVPPFLY